MAMDIPAYPWTSMECMGREYPPTWEGAGVTRVCWCIFAQTFEPTKKTAKNYKTTENQHFVAKSAAQFQYFYENSMVFPKVRCEFSQESVRVNLRRSKDKRGSITRIIYKNNKKNRQSTFVCDISYSIPGFV